MFFWIDTWNKCQWGKVYDKCWSGWVCWTVVTFSPSDLNSGRSISCWWHWESPWWLLFAFYPSTLGCGGIYECYFVILWLQVKGWGHWAVLYFMFSKKMKSAWNFTLCILPPKHKSNTDLAFLIFETHSRCFFLIFMVSHYCIALCKSYVPVYLFPKGFCLLLQPNLGQFSFFKPPLKEKIFLKRILWCQIKQYDICLGFCLRFDLLFHFFI